MTENVKRALTFSSSEEEGASRPPGGEAGRAGLLLYLGCDLKNKSDISTLTRGGMILWTHKRA